MWRRTPRRSWSFSTTRSKREAMGRLGRLRIEEELGWPYQRDAYVGVYDKLVGRHRVRG